MLNLKNEESFVLCHKGHAILMKTYLVSRSKESRSRRGRKAIGISNMLYVHFQYNYPTFISLFPFLSLFVLFLAENYACSCLRFFTFLSIHFLFYIERLFFIAIALSID